MWRHHTKNCTNVMETIYTIDYMIKHGERFARKCDECQCGTNEVYIVGDCEEYYCSDECLQKHYTKKEWNKMYKNDEAYWTSFYDNLDGDIDESDVEYILFENKLIQLQNY